MNALDGAVRRLEWVWVPALLVTIPLEVTSQIVPRTGLDLSRVVMVAGLVAFGLQVAAGRRRLRLPRSGSFWALIALLLIALLSGLLTDPRRALGPLAVLGAYLVLLILVFNVARDEPPEASWRAFVIAGAGIAALTLLLHATGTALWRADLASGYHRVAATFADPDVLVRYLAMVLGAGVVLFAGWRGRWRHVAAAAAGLAALAAPFTYSRAGYGLVLLIGAAAVWVAPRRRPALALALACLVLYLGAFAVDQPSQRRVRDFLGLASRSATAAATPAPPPWGQRRPAATESPVEAAGSFRITPAQAVGPVAVTAAAGTPADGVAIFGPPATPAPGRYEAWVQARVAEDTSPDATIRLGAWDDTDGTFLPSGYSDVAPRAFGQTYGWIRLGPFDVPEGKAVAFRMYLVGVPKTDWSITRFVLVPAPDAEPAAAGYTPMAASHPDVPWWRTPIDRLPLDEQRRYLAVAGIQMFIDHPVTGVGYAGYQRSLLGPYHAFIVHGYNDSLPHTSIVAVAAELGTVGLALLALVILLLVRETRAARGRPGAVDQRLAALLLLAIFAGSQFEGRLFTEPFLWVLLGIGYAGSERGRRARAEKDQRHVVLLTHYFPPEVGAPQTRLYELAVRTAAAGNRVTVVTGMPNYPTGVIAPGYGGRARSIEHMDGLEVIRTWVYATPNRGFVKRLANHLSFCLSSLLALPRLRDVDLVFVESPPLFLGMTAWVYRAVTGAPYVFNVSDIWPQSAVELGALRQRPLIWLAERLELASYRAAARVSVVTEGIRERLEARGVPAAKLFVLTNGVDADFYRPAPKVAAGARKVFLYAGTHGLAQGLDVVLDAARLLDRPDVEFLLVGEGADKDRLVALAAGLPNVRFGDPVAKAQMPALLNDAYATVIPLRRLDLFKGALPSKMFEAMATERPILLGVWGEAAELVTAADCGLVVPPEDAAALAAAVGRLADDPREAARLGANGRRYVLEHFSREALCRRFLGLVEQAVRA